MVRRIDLDQRRSSSWNDFDRWGLRASLARFSVHQLKAAIRQLRKAWWPKRPKPTRRNGTWLSASIATLFADFPKQVAAEAARYSCSAWLQGVCPSAGCGAGRQASGPVVHNGLDPKGNAARILVATSPASGSANASVQRRCASPMRCGWYLSRCLAVGRDPSGYLRAAAHMESERARRSSCRETDRRVVVSSLGNGPFFTSTH
jgi:hypothetical protein